MVTENGWFERVGLVGEGTLTLRAPRAFLLRALPRAVLPLSWCWAQVRE